MSLLPLIIFLSLQNMGVLQPFKRKYLNCFGQGHGWLLETYLTGQRQDTHWTSCQFFAGPHALAHSLTPMANLEFSVCLTVGFF